MLTKKISYKILQLCVLALMLFASCKKSSQNNQPDNSIVQKAKSITKIFDNELNIEKQLKLAQNNRIESYSAYTASYAITTGCSSNTLDMTKIYVLWGTPVGNPSSFYLIINGVTFYPTYVGKYLSVNREYKLLNIPLTSIGISDFCSATSITVDYYVNNAYTNSETLPINEGVSCGSGSYQCITSSPGTGQLSFFVPFISCGCANMYPPTYTFKYKLQGTSTWTNVPVSYSTYFSPTTISGLPAGVYDVLGQNTCSQNHSPLFVPAMPSTVTVP